MVSISTIIAMCVTLFVTLILPIVVCLVFAVRNKGAGILGAWIIGAGGFVIMQLIIRTPILNLLAQLTPLASFATNHYILYTLILAVTAALFEVIARCGVAKILNRKQLTLKKGVAAGLGHGGIEAILLIGLTYINNILCVFLINSGTLDSIVNQAVSSGADTTALITLKDSLISTNSAMFFLAGYERILTMVVHLALSLLVCYGFWKGNAKRNIILSFAFHLALDFIVPLINGLSTPYLGNILTTNFAYILIYAFMTCMAIFAVIMIVKVYGKWKAEEQIKEGLVYENQ